MPIQLLMIDSAESCQVLSIFSATSASGISGIASPFALAVITRSLYSSRIASFWTTGAIRPILSRRSATRDLEEARQHPRRIEVLACDLAGPARELGNRRRATVARLAGKIGLAVGKIAFVEQQIDAAVASGRFRK